MNDVDKYKLPDGILNEKPREFGGRLFLITDKHVNRTIKIIEAIDGMDGCTHQKAIEVEKKLSVTDCIRLLFSRRRVVKQTAHYRAYLSDLIPIEKTKNSTIELLKMLQETPYHGAQWIETKES